jgi:enamine deaminase RidA (YjgF/YER057c/UK114 family)
MATIDKFCAPGVFDPQTYSQGIKVSQAQTILFLSGQVAYTAAGTSRARRAARTKRLRPLSNLRAGRWPTSSRSRRT